MHAAHWIFAAAVSLATASPTRAADAEGPADRADEVVGAGWQGRLSLGTTAPTFGSTLGASVSAVPRVQSLSLMGDYHFGLTGIGLGSGSFRATSGVIFGPRSALWAGLPNNGLRRSAFTVERRSLGSSASSSATDMDTDVATLPYLGVGYAGLSSGGGWSVSADLGLVALAPGNAVRLGRVFSGTQSLDDVLRDMRLAPVIQLGVSYSF